MSTIKVTNLRHENATSDNISLDSSGNVSAAGNLSVTGTTTLTDDLNVDSGSLFVDASADRVGVGTNAPDSPVHIKGTAQMFPRVETTSTTNDAGWKFKNGTREWSTFVNGTDGAYRIYDETASANRMRIASDGEVMIGHSSAVSGFQFLSIRVASGQNGASFEGDSDAGRSMITFRNTNGEVGYISTSGSSTGYSTSSDYRLKENVVAVSDGIVRLKQLQPSRFNFIADPDKTVDGFIAHEVQDVVPEAIFGEKDAVDDEGNPKYQGIDQSKLVPLLTAALQEAITKIETLETANASQAATIAALDARLTALEA